MGWPGSWIFIFGVIKCSLGLKTLIKNLQNEIHFGGMVADINYEKGQIKLNVFLH